MQAVWVEDRSGSVMAADIELPLGAFGDVNEVDSTIPVTRVWLAHVPAPMLFARQDSGPILAVILDGSLRLEGTAVRKFGRGDVAFIDLRDDAARFISDGDLVWALLLSAPGWTPKLGQIPHADSPVNRAGGPLMNRMYVGGGTSFTEPFWWPGDVSKVPPVAEWVPSEGAFVIRTVYSVPGIADWHRAPRRQLCITLTGSGENQTEDGVRTQTAAGDFMFVEDVTGRGHISRGCGDRRILFVTVPNQALRRVGSPPLSLPDVGSAEPGRSRT
jgi:hypothetical protein